MLTFSNSSMLMSVLFSNILLIILYFIFQNTKFMLEIGHKLLAMLIAITALRFLFPFEIACSTNINLPGSLSYLMICFKKPFIYPGNYSLSVWHIFLLIWAIGSGIALIRYLFSYRSFLSMIKLTGTDISTEEPCQTQIKEICKAYKKKNHFHIVELNGIASPMITGIHKPYILIPKDFHVETQDMYYILSHEAAHFFHHDLLLKLCSEILCILYWWNPFVKILKQQITTMLELRVDLKITDSSDPQERIHYLNCLINTAKTAVPSYKEPAVSFCNANTSLLSQRFSIIMNSPQKKISRKKQFWFSFLFIGLYFFSIFFIFEPFYIPPETEEGIFYATPDNSYLIKNPNGTYDFYHNDTYISTISRIDESLSHLPVYD